MTQIRKPGGTIVSAPRATPRRHVLAVACTLVLFTTQWAHAQEQPVQGQPVQGQQAQAATGQDATDQTQEQATAAQQQPTTLGTVEVKGIRHSIATSVETKNESTSIVEAISAEDIGKLPDVSIADSISRLPGLAT